MTKRPKMLIAIFLLTSTSLTFSQVALQPDSVAKNFVDSARSLDLKGMMSCFAIDEYIRNYDFQTMVNYVETINLQAQLLPGKYGIYQEMNKYSRTMRVVAQIEVCLLSLVTGENVFSSPILVEKPDQIANFIAKIDPAPIQNIKLRDIRYPVPQKDNEKMLKLYTKQAKVDGAMDCTERVALVDVNGVTYALPFRFLKYGNSWLISGLNSSYAGVFGAAKQSEADYALQYPKW